MVEYLDMNNRCSDCANHLIVLPKSLLPSLNPPQGVGLVLEATKQKLQIAHLAKFDVRLQAHPNLQGKRFTISKLQLL